MEFINILIVGSNPEEKDNIGKILSGVEYIIIAGEADSAEEAVKILEKYSIDVALIDANVRIPGDGYYLAEKISGSYPETAAIIIEKELREEIIRKAIFSGARDVLVSPLSPSQLVDAVQRTYMVKKKQEASHKTKTSRSRKRNRQGQVLTVFSTKGGVGKTFIATNLAVALRQNTDARVALVDLDLDLGNAALFFKITTPSTVSNAVNEINRLDQDLIEDYLVSHSSGIKLLAADAQPEMTELITAEHVETILKILQEAFDYVVVDMPACFYDQVSPAIKMADHLFVVATPEVASLRNVKVCLDTFQMLNYSRDKIRILLNEANSRGDIRPPDVEKALKCDLYGLLPAEYQLASSSLNQGIPIVTLYPRSRISRNFQKLARRINGQEQEQPHQKRQDMEMVGSL